MNAYVRAQVIPAAIVALFAIPLVVFSWRIAMARPGPKCGVNEAMWQSSIIARGDRVDPDAAVTYRAWFNLGSAALQNGNVNKAVQCFRVCVDGAPRGSREWLNATICMGLIAELLGEQDKADKWMAQFSRYHPSVGTMRTAITGSWRALRKSEECKDE